MIRATALLIVLAFASCKQKEMTLADLEKAKWDSLKPGIRYLSTNNEEGIDLKTDSIQFTLVGTTRKAKDTINASAEELSRIYNKRLAIRSEKIAGRVTCVLILIKCGWAKFLC